ncbi:hypothetical protein SAMN05444336_10397 [Albimonas donghaensis]|uniref:Uncharacterized protein n=1 Tax=Albimonas donghaensis TaxID=356660 RepID=A0A1H2YE07_9RHOB|nr:hypothetical protein [Albimonas donghaensis]SDX03406.1 hypothetical protein SAMN05444336_10397 [Albimonas donghaensis]
MDALRARFDLRPGAELAIESDPRTLIAEMVARIGEMGFTRIDTEEVAPILSITSKAAWS